MFDGVVRKLERAEYFLQHLKDLREEYGSLASVGRRQQEMRATLDGFFFELVSAKDFFLQGVNDKFVQLPRDEATQISKLKNCLDCRSAIEALGVVKQLEKKLSDPSSWLWEINNYRNSATHRELLPLGLVWSSDTEMVRTYLFKDPENPSQGNAEVEVIPYCEQSLDKMKRLLENLYSQLKIQVN